MKIFDLSPSSIDWTMLLPYLFVSGAGVLALILRMFAPKGKNQAILTTSVLGLILAAVALIIQFIEPKSETFGQMLLRDRIGLILQLMLVGACFLTVLFSENYLKEKDIAFGEFYPLLLWGTAGAMMMVGTTHFLTLFLGLEVLSISLYVLSGLSRKEKKSEESALKYFLLGAFASGFLLYGIAFFYGATGGLDLGLFSKAFETGDLFTQRLLLFSLGLMLVGFLFKAAYFPFHQWTPDVYQGAPSNVTAFMASGVKIAAIGVFYRVLQAAFPLKEFWFPLVFWIAILTMCIGNFTALMQKDLKRVLAYSSIANAGYLLVAILSHLHSPEKIGLGATFFYLISYTLVVIGAFAILTLCLKKGNESTRYEDLYGLSKRSPYAALVWVVLIASLLGAPPTAGFFGKFLIINDALQSNLTALAIVLIVNAVVAGYYYLAMIRAAFATPNPEYSGFYSSISFGFVTTTLICAAGALTLSFFMSDVVRWVGI